MIPLMTDLRRELRRRGGAAQVRDLSAPRRELDRALAAGEIVRIGRGAYALPDVDHDVRTAVAAGGVLGCVSALRRWQVDVPGDESVVHVSVPRGRGTRAGTARAAKVRQHYEDADRHPVLPVTTFAAAAVRAALCLPYDSAVATLDRALHQRPDAVRDEVFAMVRRTSPSRARAFAVDVDPRSRSAVETQVRLDLRRVGLAVAPNVSVPGVGEVDLLVDGVLDVEIDGYEFHHPRPQFAADRRRDRAALRLGVPTVRFAYEDAGPGSPTRCSACCGRWRASRRRPTRERPPRCSSGSRTSDRDAPCPRCVLKGGGT